MQSPEGAFQQWLSQGKPLSEYEYWRGNLAADRVDLFQLDGSPRLVANDPANSLAELAMAAYEAKQVFLVQRRVHPGVCAYLAIKRKGA